MIGNLETEIVYLHILFTTLKFILGGLAYLMILVIAVGATAFVTLLLPN